jgi:hypothetical protein
MSRAPPALIFPDRAPADKATGCATGRRRAENPRVAAEPVV